MHVQMHSLGVVSVNLFYAFLAWAIYGKTIHNYTSIHTYLDFTGYIAAGVTTATNRKHSQAMEVRSDG